MPYGIVLDVYEGSLEVNEEEFIKGGVIGVIIRINDIKNGMRRDTNFDKQWWEAARFNPVPYFVYDPKSSGLDNFSWLLMNMPACPAVFIDSEVRATNLTPQQYGEQYNIFIERCKQHWKSIIYTGADFIDDIYPWPQGHDIWWAAYPKSLYPDTRINITWDQLHALCDKLPWPPINSTLAPGPVKIHQCSGDRLIVPGTSRAIDVSIFPGTSDEYKTWVGYDIIALPIEDTMTNILNVPFVSQVSTEAQLHNNDCGAACVLMLLKAYNIGNMTVNQVFDAMEPTGDLGLAIGTMQTFLASKGIKNEYKVNAQLHDLFDAEIYNRPVICLIHYAPLVDAGLTEFKIFRGAHFVTVIGMDVKYIYIHDPYSVSKGNQLAVPIPVFLQAWQQANLDSNPVCAMIDTAIPIKDLTPIIPSVPPDETPVKYVFGINPANGAPVIAVNIRSGPAMSFALTKQSPLYKSKNPEIMVVPKVVNGYAQLADRSGWIFIAYFKLA